MSLSVSPINRVISSSKRQTFQDAPSGDSPSEAVSAAQIQQQGTPGLIAAITEIESIHLIEGKDENYTLKFKLHNGQRGSLQIGKQIDSIHAQLLEVSRQAGVVPSIEISPYNSGGWKGFVKKLGKGFMWLIAQPFKLFGSVVSSIISTALIAVGLFFAGKYFLGRSKAQVENLSKKAQDTVTKVVQNAVKGKK
jgi:hypothetical protein